LIIYGEKKCFAASDPLANLVKTVAIRPGSADGTVVDHLSVGAIDTKPSEPGSYISLLIFATFGILQFGRIMALDDNFHSYGLLRYLR
jgi:hypothetical protein